MTVCRTLFFPASFRARLVGGKQRILLCAKLGDFSAKVAKQAGEQE